MKKQIAIAMGLAVLSTPVLASKARLEALGEDANGSMFISDSRNIFLNAASVNFHKDMVTFEWGANQSADSATTPRAEGGFLKAMGNMVYGLHFGNASDTSHAFRGSAGVGLTEENALDLFVGGDAGIQWGANLTYTSTEDEATDVEQSAMRARLGVVSGNISAFANINISNKAEAGTAEFEGKSGYDLGVTYEMNDMSYMARYQALSGEDQPGDELSVANTSVGVAKAYTLNDRANLWVSAWYKMESTENDMTGPAATQFFDAGETKRSFVPVTVATEVQVKDWLVLRGSVGHTIWGTEEDDNGDKKSKTDAFVNAGASLVFGDFQVDGLIGNNDDTGAAGTSATEGTLRGDTLLSRVSMTYRF